MQLQTGLFDHPAEGEGGVEGCAECTNFFFFFLVAAAVAAIVMVIIVLVTPAAFAFDMFLVLLLGREHDHNDGEVRKDGAGLRQLAKLPARLARRVQGQRQTSWNHAEYEAVSRGDVGNRALQEGRAKDGQLHRGCVGRDGHLNSG